MRSRFARIPGWVVAALAALSLGASPADALTINLTGNIPIDGVPTDFTASPFAAGDPFTAVITYDESTPVADDSPASDLYVNALIAFSVTFGTSTGPVTFASTNAITASTANVAAVSATGLIMQLADYDRNGALAPLTGPHYAGNFLGVPLNFAPVTLTLEVEGNFAAALAGNLLPAGPFDTASLRRVTVGFWADFPGAIREVGLQGLAGADGTTPVPEPSTLLLLTAGLAGALGKRRRTHARR